MHSILKGKEKIVTAENKEVLNKILKGIEKYYKPERKIKFKLVGENKWKS